MSSGTVTSSAGARRTRSVTKQIRDFESNLFLMLPKPGRKSMIGMLEGYDIMQLDTSMCNRNGRKALLEAYEGTEIFGFEFPYEPPAWRDDGNYENPEELCEGLEWAEDRGIIAREYTLKLPNSVFLSKNRHLPMLIQRKRRAMARLIITRCFKSYDINAHGSDGYTPLAAAAIYNDEELLRLLCERADVLVDMQDGYERTALCRASAMGHVECMRILLDVGKADVNGLTYGDCTALHGAALHGSPEAAALLIERGAKVNAVDACGKTPLDWSQDIGHSRVEMVAFLKSKGAKRGSQLLPAPQPST